MTSNYLKNNRFSASGKLFALLLLGLIFCASAFTPAVTRAQNTSYTNTLKLQGDQEIYKLLPYIHVTRNNAENLNADSFKRFIARHLSGDRGDIVPGTILNLGAADMPHWIIFSVDNQSWTNKWVLSLGTHAQGRMGLVKDIFVYDNVSKRTYINTLSASNNKYVKKEKLSGTVLHLDIPQGQKALIFAYIVPSPGMPTTIVPELMTEDAYAKTLSSVLGQTRLLTYFFMAMVGFFLATILIRQMWDSTLYMFYYIVLLVMLRHQNDLIQIDFVFSAHTPGIFLNLSVILGLYISKSFLGIGKLQRSQARLISTFTTILISTTVAATILIPDTSGMQLIVMYFPPLIALLFLTLLSVTQGYTEHPEGYHLAFGWFAVFMGALLSLISLMNIFVPPAPMISSFWYGLVIQGAFFITGFVSRMMIEERTSDIIKQEQKKEKDSVENITASREASENARLLRLIEHERQVMNELRDREAQQNEEMRKAKEDADLANNAKSAFLAVISHEIRTPMTGIMGMIRFLLETPLNKEQKGYAQTLQDSGDAMIALLNDILDFEKIESGKMDMEYIDFDLHRLIHGVKTLMSGHAEAKKIALKVNMDPDVPRYVIGDPVRLRQVILNLTGNSIKFTDDGSVTIHIQKDNTANGGSRATHRIRIAVEDTGVGISREAQKNLFNPFSQADSSVSRKFGGTGLGLAISQKLIEAMGGHIEISSTEGHGSTFFFTIGLEEGCAEAVERAESADSQQSQKPEKVMRILIVEDNEINQKLMKELVDRMGHETSVASSGEQALEIVKEKDLDLILMDIQLPGITGMGATKAIRAFDDREKASVPVIAMTGNVKDEDVRQCYASNMNGHLAKPIDPKKLKDQIIKVIEGKLDNPVEITEDKRDEHTRITQLGTGAAPFGATGINLESDAGPDKTPEPELKKEKKEEQKPESNLTPAQKAKAEDVAPIIAALEKDLEELESEDEAKLEEAQMKELKEMDMSLSSLDFTEDELDEDSFEQALEMAEEKENLETDNAFDRVMLESLRASIGDEQFMSLLNDMLEKASEILESIEQASNQNDVESIRARAHELKGMAGNFGFIEMSGIAARLEAAAKENQADGITELVPALPAAHDKARHAVDTWIEGGSA